MTRHVFIDWLRILAFGLLVLFHVGMYYVSWDFHLKSPHASTAIEPLMRLSSPWRLGLLFLLSGAATSFMLARGGATGALLGVRSKRLLLPLVFGMLVIVPPQSYLEVMHKTAYAGTYLEFMRLYLVGHGGFCPVPGHCLILPTWNHLWFVAYLFVYTLILWLLLRAMPSLLDGLARRLPRALGGLRLLWLPILVLALLRVLLAGRFPSTHALLDDWFNHAQYLTLFVGGAALARVPALWSRMEGMRWAALAIAVAAWLLWMLNIAPGTPWLRLLVATLQWGATVAAIGFAHRHLRRDNAARRYLTEAVFPVYILHQTIIIVLAHACAPWHLPPLVEAPLLIVATFLLSFAGFELVRRVGPMRPWFGLAPIRHSGETLLRLAPTK